MDEATRKAFELLGVPPTADKKAVTVAYRDLTVVWHPDRLPKGNERLAKKANEKLKELNAARDLVLAHLKRPSAPKAKPSPRSRPKPSSKPSPRPRPKPSAKPTPQPDDALFTQAEAHSRRDHPAGPWDTLSHEHAILRGPGDGQVVAWSIASPMPFVRRCYDHHRWVTAVAARGESWLTVCSRWASLEGQRFNTHTSRDTLKANIRTNYDDGYGIQVMALAPNDVSAIAMVKGRSGSESWMRRPSWPKERIRTNRRERNEVVAAVTGIDQDWMVLTAEMPGWGSQRISHRSDWDGLVEAVKQVWDEGRRITNLAYNDHGYALIATENTGLGRQSVRHAMTVAQLRSHCEKFWTEGKVLTHVCPDNDGWVLVFSTHPQWG